MRIVTSSNKTYLVRHWLRWYRVKDSFRTWELLDTKPKPKVFNIEATAKMLKDKY